MKDSCSSLSLFPGSPKPWRSWFQARFNCEGSLRIKTRPSNNLLKVATSWNLPSRFVVDFLLVVFLHRSVTCRFSWAPMSLDDILRSGKCINRPGRGNSRACSGEAELRSQQSVASISISLQGWNQSQKTPEGCQTRCNFY